MQHLKPKMKSDLLSWPIELWNGWPLFVMARSGQLDRPVNQLSGQLGRLVNQLLVPKVKKVIQAKVAKVSLAQQDHQVNQS
jgi:hypothetical protein